MFFQDPSTLSPRKPAERTIDPNNYLRSKSWRLTEEQLNWAIEQKQKGISGASIAASIGCSLSALYGALRSVGLGRSR